MSTNGSHGHHKHNDHSDWTSNARWFGTTRPYSYADVLRLRGSIQIEYTLARLGAERLWNLMHTDAYVPALGAVTGNQAIEMVQAGLKAIYGSGWQVAADAQHRRRCLSGPEPVPQRQRARARQAHQSGVAARRPD